MKSKKAKCRVCLQLRSDLKDLSDRKNSIPRLKILLQDAFFDITGIMITELEPARLICTPCTAKLRGAIDFQMEAKNAHTEIERQIIEGIWDEELKPEEETLDVKLEEDDDDDLDDDTNHFEDTMTFDEPEFEPQVKIEMDELEVKEEEKKPEIVHHAQGRVKAEIEFDQAEILRLGLKRYKKTGKKESKRYVCEVCGFETMQEWKVMQHIKNTHMSEVVRPKKKANYVKNDSRWVRRQLKLGKTLICDHCGEDFVMYRDLHSHMRKNHVVLRPFNCVWEGCPKAFCSQLQLDKHVNYRHYSKSMCEVCGINILKSSMKDHLKTHRADRPFACPHQGCTTAFKDKNGLTQHLACVHNQERKFACHICGRSYKLSTTLLAHIRVTHTFENCSQCDQCQRWFLNVNQLQIHVNQVHLNLRPFPCELCGSSHKSQAKMYRHLRQMHPETYQVLFESGKLKCRKRIEANQPQHRISQDQMQQ